MKIEPKVQKKKSKSKSDSNTFFPIFPEFTIVRKKRTQISLPYYGASGTNFIYRK